MKSFLIKFALVVGLISLSGCSLLTEARLNLADRFFGREPADAPNELKDIQAEFSAKVDWSKQLGRTGQYDYYPSVDAGAVYSANAEGDLYKVDLATGKEIWRANVEEPISGSVGNGGGIVVVGTKKGNVIAYSVDGQQLWKAKVSSEVLSAPRYADGNVVVRSGDSRIYGLDAADGTRKWVYEKTVPALSLRSSAGIVVDGGAVYAGFAGGKMVALRADNGKIIWEATVARPKGVTEIERISDITSLPAVNGPVVYAVAYQGRVAAIDRRSGKVIWNRDISSYAGLEFADGRLYIAHTLGSLYSLDYETGRTFWRQGDLLHRRLTKPLPMGDMVAIGDLEGYVHFLDIDSGKFASRIKVDDAAVMGLALGEGPSQVIVATRDGGLFSVSKLEGAPPASTQEKPAIESIKQPDDEFDTDDSPAVSPATQKNKAAQPAVIQPDDEFESDVELPVITEEQLDTPIKEVPKKEAVEREAPLAPTEGQAVEPVVEEAEEASRSILFNKDNILLPDEPVDGGPGITLPKAQ